MQSRTYSDKEWRQMFVELKDESVCWYPLATGVVRVLFSCGEFPNVPLMGTLGCINYNPVLALRQLRYPLTDPPSKELVSSFTADLKDGIMLGKIRKAWKHVIYKAGELGIRSHGEGIAYKEWVRSRVEGFQLPFQTLTPKPLQEEDTVIKDSDEVKILKEKSARTEKEKGALEDELKKTRLTVKALEMECSEKNQSFERVSKRARLEKESGNKTREHLSATNQNLKEQIAECHNALKENKQLRKALEERKQEVNALQAQINEQASRHEMDRRFDKQASLEVLKEYRESLEEEQSKVEGLRRDREEILEENWKLKGEIVSLEAAQGETQRQLINLNRRMKEMIDQYVSQYEEKIRNFRAEASGTIQRYKAVIERKDEELRNLEHWAEERGHFIGLIRAVEVNH